MVTSFGKMLRKMRIDKNELLAGMADKLGVSPAYLSAVENGKRRVPPNWVNNIARLYQLNSTQKEELLKAVDEDSKTVEMNLEGVDEKRRNLAFSFARRFDNLTEKELESLQKIFQK